MRIYVVLVKKEKIYKEYSIPIQKNWFTNWFALAILLPKFILAFTLKEMTKNPGTFSKVFF